MMEANIELKSINYKFYWELEYKDSRTDPYYVSEESQEFNSLEEAIDAMRNNEIKWQ